ncbi:MAG: PEP-CTERM sorting domain-containing protein [Chthonomonadaceae bacterium]|nr:PEP-CTERM sorting domain-containing protein [Chthonomonadaceae bacterium]
MKFIKNLAFVAALLSASAMSMARTDHNSFINRPAGSLSELMKQVQNEKSVSSRYERHFGMTKAEVLEMFSHLRLGRLPADGVYIVYNVPTSEEVRSRALMFKKGTLVWVDEDGKPVLKASCGNPMVRGTDIGTALVQSGVKIEPTNVVRDLMPQNPQSEFIAMEPTAIPPAPLEARAAEAMPVRPMVPTVPSIGATGLGIIPIIGGLLIGIDHGGNDVIPEPASLLAFGGCIAGYMARRRKSGR